MKNIKGWITTGVIAAALIFSTTQAHAGIIFTGLSEPTGVPCSEPTENNSTSDDLGGIIFAGLTGIIFAGFTGDVYTKVTGVEPSENCGIIFTGKS